jgi:hypothetical protein
MTTLHPHKVGLALGGIFAAFHFLWSVLVALGIAQIVIDWIFLLHFIQPPFTIRPFDLLLAAMLVVMTFIVGYVVGYAFALLWNKLHT